MKENKQHNKQRIDSEEHSPVPDTATDGVSDRLRTGKRTNDPFDEARVLRLILDQEEEIAAMGSWNYNIASRMLTWSPGMYRLFNITPDTPVSPATYFDYTSGNEKQLVSDMITKMTESFVPFEYELTLIPFGYPPRKMKVKAVIDTKQHNQPVNVVGVNLDMTWQGNLTKEAGDINSALTKKNEELRVLNEELKIFNDITSHDYKETLRMLYTNFEHIIERDARNLSDTSRANIRRAQSAIQRMKLLTDDIITYLQLNDIGVHSTMIDPNEILIDQLSRMKGKFEQAGAEIEIARLPPLRADALLFSKLLYHLFDNAIKFRKLVVSPTIRVKYSLADEMNSIPAARRNTSYTIISVSDNGIGFSEEETDKLFDLFYKANATAGNRGSGIGLAVCRKIMTMHEGFITADGSPAHGATFNCYFPNE